MDYTSRLEFLWKNIYPNSDITLLHNFLKSIEIYKNNKSVKSNKADWYKDAVIYSLYVDRFNNDFSGLENKLDYLQDLGVNCLWLLPILESPMRDAGFDISDHYSVRDSLFANKNTETNIQFKQFVNQAHKRGINIIFDFAINHTSDQHPWFLEAKKCKNNPYRNYYIWADDDKGYADARIIFKGIEDSNWQKCDDQYYFHRFFNFQPDLNYKNPEVLFSMCRAMLYWQNIGIDGFRADAIPYLWKEEGTDCENLPQTHKVVKFFRAVLDFVSPGTLLLAEACQQPNKVVEYFGDGDECHAAYHFPLMPRMFKAIAQQDGNPIIDTLDEKFTPIISPEAQWFTFLRCHDELSLELVYVTEEERKFIHEHYCHKELWDFRNGEGISARLADLMQYNADKILLAYSIMLTLTGSPIIYYGDEFATVNDEDLYYSTIEKTGKDDTRFLVRNYINWNDVENDLKNKNSLPSKVFYPLKNIINVRNKYNVFGRGTLHFDENNKDKNLLIYKRKYENISIQIIHNLSEQTKDISDFTAKHNSQSDLLGNKISDKLAPYGFLWILC
ncbi:MAG: alpha-amylase family glycosyl hydrolase [Lentimicrobiaceae bacterium]|nr:alpha-amylase family glycosyl hydrolase [Lentimicrobiaceae bacterium]